MVESVTGQPCASRSREYIGFSAIGRQGNRPVESTKRLGVIFTLFSYFHAELSTFDELQGAQSLTGQSTV
jgi:hypothetical protein